MARKLEPLSDGGPLSPRLCCSVQRSGPVERLERFSCSSPMGRYASVEKSGPVERFWPEDPGNPKEVLKSAWQTWLDDWDERQRDNLRHYERTTKELVDELRNDVIKKLNDVEKACSSSAVRRGVVIKQPTEQKKRESHRDSHMENSAEVNRVSESSDLSPRSPHERHSQCSHQQEGHHHAISSADRNKDMYRKVGTGLLSAVSHADQKSNAGLHSWRPMKSYQHMNDAMTEVVGAVKFARSYTRHTNATLLTRDTKHSNATSAIPGIMTYEPTFLTETTEFLPQNDCQRFLYAVVHHNVFAAMSGILIGAYAIAVGVVADLEMRATMGTGQEQPTWRFYMDIVFTTLCILEFLLRLIAEGVYFFRGQDRNWNMFDMVVAVMGVLDMTLADIMNFTFLRVLRIVRAMRLLRVIRFFRVFKELRLMMASILCCLVPLTSAFALLVIVIYIFAVILLQGASDYVQSGRCSKELENVLRTNFSGMSMTIYSLTQAISGGRSWAEFADPFIEISVWYGVFFAAFVIFVIFGVLNILTGVFVEATTTLANVDKELVIQEQIARNESAVGQMRNLFREIDDNNSGTITHAELLRNLKDERVRAYFSVLEMDVSEAHGLFQLLDRDESGEVSIDEFIMNCMRLKGTARSLDLAAMLFENKRLHKSLRTFMANVDELMREVQCRLGVLQTYHEASLFT